MTGITTIAALPGSGSGCQSALPAEAGKAKQWKHHSVPTFSDDPEFVIEFWYLGDAEPTKVRPSDLLDAAGGGE